MQSDQALQVSAGLSWQLSFCYHRGGVCRVTCAAPRRNIPIALRPARNSATSTFPSLLVSSLSNKSWYDLSLSASQHRTPGSKNVRSARYMIAGEWGQRSQESCETTDPFEIQIQLQSWWKPAFLVAFFPWDPHTEVIPWCFAANRSSGGWSDGGYVTGWISA